MKTPRTRKEMIAYLDGHFRYDTMNSWNQSTSYARCVKVHKLTFPDNDSRNRAYDLLNVDSAFFGVRRIIAEFNKRHCHSWQIGFNGRSGGYLVLYQGGVRTDGYKRRCEDCGQGNYKADSVKCGRCGSDAMEDYTAVQTFTYPGKSTDQGEDFDEWSTDSLASRVKLIVDFDRTVDACIKSFVDFCAGHKPKIKTIHVPKEITVAEPV